MKYGTRPGPVPSSRASLIHESRVCALHSHEDPVATSTVPMAPCGSAARPVGSIEKVQSDGAGAGGAAACWLTVCVADADPLVTTTDAVRGAVVVFAATVYETAPGPVPLDPPLTVANPLADAVH